MSGPSMGATNMVNPAQQPGYVGPFGQSTNSITYQTHQPNWAQFFGPTSRPIETAQYGAYRRENWALPDAYRGSNHYLTNIIIQLISEQARKR